MRTNTSIESWIKKAEIEIDYYTMFIKAWIPFNAWYYKNYYDENSNPSRKTDRAIIEFLGNNNNVYKNKIVNYLSTSHDEAKYFKLKIYNLYKELEKHKIGNESIPTFENTSVQKNGETESTLNYNKHIYHAKFNATRPKTEKRFICEVVSANDQKTKVRIELMKWSKSEFSDEINKHSLTDIQKTKLEIVFNNINPNKPENIVVLIENNQSTRGLITINEEGKLYFKSDLNLVSKVIIHILYGLRNKLFHGEIEPNETNVKIYKYAYEIQNLLIKSLR